MKNFFLLLLFTTLCNCKAQTPILPLNGGTEAHGDTYNAYYKDINNFLNQYEGTWQLTQGSIVLKLMFLKKLMVYRNEIGTPYYTDYIVGEYQYIDVVEKINTLNNLLINHSSLLDYGLSGNIALPNNLHPQCAECTTGEKRLVVDIYEPVIKEVSGLEGEMVFRKFTENGVDKLKVWFYKSHSGYGYTENDVPTSITKHTIPYGVYILTKVP